MLFGGEIWNTFGEIELGGHFFVLVGGSENIGGFCLIILVSECLGQGYCLGSTSLLFPIRLHHSIKSDSLAVSSRYADCDGSTT